MLNITIIVLILLGLTMHRYLTVFGELKLLPYSMGFLFFANSFMLIYFVSFIWMFGIIGGIVTTLLCALQVVYCTGLWIFSLPGLINTHKKLNDFENPKVNLLVYSGFSFLVILIAILTAINFFISDYKSMWELMGDSSWTLILIFLGILVVGNIARVAVLSKVMKE